MTTDTTERGLERLICTAMVNDDTQLFKYFADNEGFKRWLTDSIFNLTYEQPERADRSDAAAVS